MQITEHLGTHTPTARQASRGIEMLARAGFATKGVVYMLIGGLAVLAATSNGGQVGGGKEAIQTIGSQPFGQILLAITGVGLVGFALWRFVQAALDPEHEGKDGKAIVKRVGFAVSGFMHAALAIVTFQMAFGGGSGGDGGGQTYLDDLMGAPFGRFLVGAIGVAVILAGLAQFYRGYKATFTKELRTGEMSSTERTWTTRLGRAGFIARGIIFPIIGYSLIQTAVNYSADQQASVGGALSELGSQSHGAILLGVVAAGLFCYGIFQLALAKYRRFEF